MAQKLETLEDFQRVAKALADPDAKPHEYCVQSFGYCTHCLKVTSYTSESGPEGGIIVCKECLRRDAWGSYRYGVAVSAPYFTGNMVPLRYREEVAKRHSRGNQSVYFWKFLEHRWINLTQEINDAEAALEKNKQLRDALCELQREHYRGAGV